LLLIVVNYSANMLFINVHFILCELLFMSII